MRSTLNFFHMLALGLALFLIAWSALVLINIPWIGFFALFSLRIALIATGVVGALTLFVLVFLPAWECRKFSMDKFPELSDSATLMNSLIVAQGWPLSDDPSS